MQRKYYNIITLKFDDLTAEVLLADNFFDEGDIKATSSNNLHQHAHLEVFFAKEPLSIMDDDGEHVFSNSVVTIPAHHNHYTQRKNVYSFLIKFNKPRGSSGERYDKLMNTFNKSGLISTPMTDTLYFYLYELRMAIRENFADTPIKVKSLLNIIVLALLDFYSIDKDLVDQETPDRMKYILTIERILARDYAKNYTLRDLAKEFHLSEKQTSRFIRKEYGQTLSTLLNDKRLSVAKQLLATTNMSVSEVIDFLNFKSESYFFALFKKKYGFTPYSCSKKRNVID